MRGSILLAPLFIAAAIVSAAAADLTGADYGYLREHFGIRNDSAGIARLEPDEAATLHTTINDPAFASHPVARDDNVARYLYEVETCGTWQPMHQGEACPRVLPFDGPGGGARLRGRRSQLPCLPPHGDDDGAFLLQAVADGRLGRSEDCRRARPRPRDVADHVAAARFSRPRGLYRDAEVRAHDRISLQGQPSWARHLASETSA